MSLKNLSHILLHMTHKSYYYDFFITTQQLKTRTNVLYLSTVTQTNPMFFRFIDESVIKVGGVEMLEGSVFKEIKKQEHNLRCQGPETPKEKSINCSVLLA